MTRSKKKVPVVGICSHTTEAHSKAKKRMSRDTRMIIQATEDMPNGAYYKKFMHSWVWRPDDGKTWTKDPRSYRK